MSIQKLTQKRVRELTRAGMPGEFRDAAARGLILRVRSSSSHSWSVRRHLHSKNHRLELGSDWTLEEARDLAREVDRRVRAKMDPFWRDPRGWQDFLQAKLYEKHDIDSELMREPVEPPVDVPHMPEGPAMTWTEGRDLWLAKVGDNRREATVESYRKSLRIREMVLTCP